MAQVAYETGRIHRYNRKRAMQHLVMRNPKARQRQPHDASSPRWYNLHDIQMSRHGLLSAKLRLATEPSANPFFLTSHEPSFEACKAGGKGTDWLPTVQTPRTLVVRVPSQIPGFDSRAIARDMPLDIAGQGSLSAVTENGLHNRWPA